jgi:hypothetical protein
MRSRREGWALFTSTLFCSQNTVQLMMTAGMVHVTNLTPGSERSSTDACLPAALLVPRHAPELAGALHEPLALPPQRSATS